jgi:hypothetical protein
VSLRMIISNIGEDESFVDDLIWTKIASVAASEAARVQV